MVNDEYLVNTLAKDSTKNTDEALLEIYEKLKPGEPATLDSAKNQLITRFFDNFRYDLAKVGRYKFNKKTKRNRSFIKPNYSRRCCNKIKK